MYTRLLNGELPTYTLELPPIPSAAAGRSRSQRHWIPCSKPRRRALTQQYCDFCNFSTSEMFHLESHNEMHNRNEKFRCPRCIYSSKQQGLINSHLKQFHVNHNRRRGVPEMSVLEQNN